MFQIISMSPTLNPLPRALRAGGNELLFCREDLKHPPTPVGGICWRTKVSFLYKRSEQSTHPLPWLWQKLNSPHGSVGMFQIISMSPTLNPLPRALRAGGNELLFCREDLKHPPTPVGGICCRTRVSFRNDLNHPPTPRGWDFDVL